MAADGESAPRTAVHVGAVLIRAAEPERLAAFYAGAFDLGPPIQGDGGHVGMRARNIYLGFDPAGEGEGGAPGRVSLWFDVDDCPAAFVRLLALGATALSAPDASCSPGETLATVTDPEGNVIGLIGPG